MFFRRHRAKVLTVSDRVDLLKKAGFDTQSQPDGRVMLAKNGIGAFVSEENKDQLTIERAGVLIKGEIATLLNQGYQMFLETPAGKRYPAQAEQLKALHQFEDDVKDTLGLTNLYNTSLGTTSRSHMYDRVNKRDSGQQPKPWEKKQTRITAPETKDSQPI